MYSTYKVSMHIFFKKESEMLVFIGEVFVCIALEPTTRRIRRTREGRG